MAGPFLPIQAVNRSQKVRIGKGASAVVLQPNVTSYVDTSDGTVRRDLQRHSAIGAYIIVGSLSTSNANIVVDNGGVVSAGTGLTVNVTAGDIHNRGAGTWVSGAAATNSTITTNTSGNPRIDLVVWDTTSGAVSVVAGTPAASPVAPATPAGKVGLATVAVANSASAPGTITDVRPRP